MIDSVEYNNIQPHSNIVYKQEHPPPLLLSDTPYVSQWEDTKWQSSEENGADGLKKQV